MQRRTIGKTTLDVFPVGLGAMPLSIQGRPRTSSARAVLDAALEAGVDFIDTADCYCLDSGDIGHNERLIGDFLHSHGVLETTVVATKGGIVRPGGNWSNDASPAHLRAACEDSLANLGVDAIALYYLHAPDPTVPFEESVGALARLREEGKIVHIGLSNVVQPEVRAAVGITSIAAVQNRCNILEKSDVTSGFVDWLASQQITYVAYSPTGGHNGHVRLGAVDTLGEIAAAHGASVHEVALAWLLAHSNIVVIPGASRPASIRSSATAAALELSTNDLDRLNAIPDWQ